MKGADHLPIRASLAKQKVVFECLVKSVIHFFSLFIYLLLLKLLLSLDCFRQALNRTEICAE